MAARLAGRMCSSIGPVAFQGWSALLAVLGEQIGSLRNEQDELDAQAETERGKDM